MEPNQVYPSPDNSWIPQGIPTGVFVPNNQTPATADKPVQNTVQQAAAPAQIQSAPVAPAVYVPGPLDKFLQWVAKFFAKLLGQPDPITGVPAVTSATAKKTESIVGKARDVANQAVAKATDAATQAAQKVQQVIPPPVAAPQTPAAAPQQPSTASVMPTQPIPEQTK